MLDLYLLNLFLCHRFHLLIIGLVSGYLGALPSVLWASGAMVIAMAPVLVPLAIWVYTLVFAFSSLWFSHYCLAVLEQSRVAAAQAAARPAFEIGSQLEPAAGRGGDEVGPAPQAPQ